jgi:hypothetical protein
MNKEQKFGCAMSVFRLLTTTPIWYFLLYKILVMVGATELMMFLFWVYAPLGFVMALAEVILKKVLEEE